MLHFVKSQGGYEAKDYGRKKETTGNCVNRALAHAVGCARTDKTAKTQKEVFKNVNTVIGEEVKKGIDYKTKEEYVNELKKLNPIANFDDPWVKDSVEKKWTNYNRRQRKAVKALDGVGDKSTVSAMDRLGMKVSVVGRMMNPQEIENLSKVHKHGTVVVMKTGRNSGHATFLINGNVVDTWNPTADKSLHWSERTKSAWWDENPRSLFVKSIAYYPEYTGHKFRGDK